MKKYTMLLLQWSAEDKIKKTKQNTTISAAYYSMQRKKVQAPGAETSGKTCIWKESGVSEQAGARW